jgi:hypothetical protein
MKTESEWSIIAWVAKNAVAGLDDRGGDLPCAVDGELELGLPAVVDGQPLQKERAEAGAGATTEGVEDHQALHAHEIPLNVP